MSDGLSEEMFAEDGLPMRQRVIDYLWIIRASYRAGLIAEAHEYERNLADDMARLSASAWGVRRAP